MHSFYAIYLGFQQTILTDFSWHKCLQIIEVCKNQKLKKKKRKQSIAGCKMSSLLVARNTIKEMVKTVETHQWAIKDWWKLFDIIKDIIHIPGA